MPATREGKEIPSRQTSNGFQIKFQIGKQSEAREKLEVSPNKERTQ
jgi:hypothetical protein